MPKVTTSHTHFYAASKTSGNFPTNSPVFFILQMPLGNYQEHKRLLDTVITEIDANSLYSSLELVVEKLNKLLSKQLVKDILSIALFQKSGQSIKIAAFPSCNLEYSTKTGTKRNTKLEYADTNRVFSEILEVETALSPTLTFSFLSSSELETDSVQHASTSCKVERETISTTIPKKEITIPKFLRSWFPKNRRTRETKHSTLNHGIKYGLALLVAVFAIVGINNAKSNKFISQKKATDAPWVKVYGAEVSPIADIKEKLPSKYVHEPAGIVKTTDFIYTFQNDPNIILQIDKAGVIKPIVIDSEKVGKLTGMKKVSNDLLLFTHDKKGVIFLAPKDQKWRLVEFSKPAIAEYTDIEVYNDYIYVLDARSREIWKLQLTENELTGAPWLKDARVDLSLASSMAIDGSVYLTLITGEVVKLSQGKKDPEFAISDDLSPKLLNADSIDIDESTGNLIILDRANNRIVTTSNTGSFLYQLKNPFPLPFDVITAEEGKLFGVIQNDVIEIKKNNSTN